MFSGCVGQPPWIVCRSGYAVTMSCKVFRILVRPLI